MGSAPEEEAALSDFEDDDLEAAPEVLPLSTTADSLKAVLAELEGERLARKAAELAKADVDSKFDRLRTLTQDVLKQRDEALRHKDEALRVKEELRRQLEDALQLKSEAIKQKEEIQRQKDEINKARESARGEVEATARLLITKAEKITASLSGTKSFSGGLPRTSRYTGLAAIAYGFTKRMEEVVDEVVRQRDDASKRRDDLQEQLDEVARQRDAASRRKDEIQEQLEHQNYTNAIEVSQLEASITELKDEVESRKKELERLRLIAAEKDENLKQLETDRTDKMNKVSEANHMIEEAKIQLEGLKIKLAKQGELIRRHSSAMATVGKSLLDVARSMQLEHEYVSGQLAIDEEDLDDKKVEQLEEDLVKLVRMIGTYWKSKYDIWQKIESDAKIARRALLEEKYEASEKLKNVLEEKENVLKALSELRLTLMQRQLSVKQVDGTDDEGEEGAHLETLAAEESNMELQVIALESEVKELRQENANCENMLQKTRAELHDIKIVASDRAAIIDRLERRQADMNQQIGGLTEDLIAAEEEVARWKAAAKEEAAAGTAVLEEEERMKAEATNLNQQLIDLKAALSESYSKLRSKEEMSQAAVNARNAAEKALLAADQRAAELRERIEEITRQLEEVDKRGDSSRGLGPRFAGLLDMCWPWLRGRGRPDAGTYASAEMEELMEPLV